MNVSAKVRARVRTIGTGTAVGVPWMMRIGGDRMWIDRGGPPDAANALPRRCSVDGIDGRWMMARVSREGARCARMTRLTMDGPRNGVPRWIIGFRLRRRQGDLGARDQGSLGEHRRARLRHGLRSRLEVLPDREEDHRPEGSREGSARDGGDGAPDEHVQEQDAVRG